MELDPVFQVGENKMIPVIGLDTFLKWRSYYENIRYLPGPLPFSLGDLSGIQTGLGWLVGLGKVYVG
jgi:hypothetical protein